MANTIFEDSLFELQNQKDESGRSYPQLTNLLPSKDSIYELDLNTRQANLPQFAGVQYDHNAEVIYFKCPRYYENVDLTEMVCIIQYINAKGQAGIYWVPYYDINYYGDGEDIGEFIENPTMLIPWVLGGLATAATGKLTFSIRLYKLRKDDNDEYHYTYNLSTRPQALNIIVGMELSDEDIAHYDEMDSVVAQIYQAIQTAMDNTCVYWTEV